MGKPLQKVKRGRPPSTGEYIGLAEAKERLVEAKRKELEIQKEKELRALTSEELFDKMGLNFEEATEDARRNPTADLSNRARKLQKRVLHVTRVSKNLRGDMQKELKLAALFTSVFVEVLRTRVESGPETDEKVQIEGLRKELEEAKRANQKAFEENERLKKELDKTEVKEGKKRRVRKRAQVLSSSSSEEEGTDAQRKKKKHGSNSPRKSPSKSGDNLARENWEDTDVEMVQGASLPVPSSEVTERAISKGVLPPREEWPPAIRPQIQGKIKILEDRYLSRHKVHIREKPGPFGDNPEKEKTASAVSLFEQLVPMLDKWIESRLGPLLPPIKSGQGKKKDGVTPTTKIAGKNSTKARSNEVASAKTIPNTGDVKGEDHTTWTQVLGRKQKVAAPSKKTGARKDVGSPKADSSKKMPGEPKPARRRPPRTAAVTLSCPSGKYAEALSKAKEEINLEELGIKNLRPRKGVTGALVLEIAGADGTNKAKQLKEKMQEALKNMEGVRVARPVKCVDLRIKDVLESTSEVEIRKAIATHGERMEEDIKVGAPQRSLNGLYTVWARCPVALANKIVSQGRLQIGWFSARVEILAARPLSCFKCLELGSGKLPKYGGQEGSLL